MATDDRSEMVLEVAKLLYSGVDFESIKVEMDATIPEPEIRWDAGPEWMD